MSTVDSGSFEETISSLIVPTDGYWPRPWVTRHDPEACSLLLVGASSAKSFSVEQLPTRKDFIDAHFNRNGATCQGLYGRLIAKPSPSRRNIDRATDMLEAAGWQVMQTNVTCASAPMDRDVSQEAREKGTEIFRAVVHGIPWRAMVVFGAGAAERLGKALGINVPAPADLGANVNLEPKLTFFNGRPVLVIPTLAPPAYRSTVWPYLERCLPLLHNAPQKSPTFEVPISKKRSATIHIEQASEHSSAGSIASSVGRGGAVAVAACGLDKLLEDHPSLYFKTGASQSSVWLTEGGKQIRLLRLKSDGTKADLLVHKDLVNLCPGIKQRFHLVAHKNPEFFRFFDGCSDNTSMFISEVRSALAVYRG